MTPRASCPAADVFARLHIDWMNRGLREAFMTGPGLVRYLSAGHEAILAVLDFELELVTT